MKYKMKQLIYNLAFSNNMFSFFLLLINDFRLKYANYKTPFLEEKMNAA